MSPSALLTTALVAGFALQLLGWVALMVTRARRVRQREARDRREAPSRAAFDRLAQAEIDRSNQLDRSIALAVLDIDELAEINERHGFATGDLRVALVRRALLDRLRRIDTAVDLGGGAWGVLVPDRDNDDAVAWLRDLRSDIQDACDVALSLGIATSAARDAVLDDLWQAADQACAAAKVVGGADSRVWNDATRDLLQRAGAHRRRQRDAQLATVLSLAEALDLRDADTSNHSRAVGRYAQLMAEELGFEPAHVERVRVAGLLHDIGKIGVPDSVLRKPAKLDDDEWAMMQAHPEIGARLLSSIDAEDIRSWVLAHHERPDGRGYPHALGADEIPVEAKILSVADAYEAMTADRVYRKAPGPRIAREELDKWRGKQFDTQVVDAFLAVLDRIEPVEETEAVVADVGLREAA